jgi:hypothetical protein
MGRNENLFNKCGSRSLPKASSSERDEKAEERINRNIKGRKRIPVMS